ncbi:MAG: dGTPase [Legionellales bacterium RIFCSPHIGHO2_12_FULL_37_14]|nr:MAG: dGTPase [Legionellales bacterium RIFCSPHIGHO2_12_FULL_37_14]
MWTQRRSSSSHKRGRNDHRSPYERDKTRIIHNPAFRRLQRKTQILGTKEGDFHRTRLTHSLEVASIGVSLVRNLQRNHKNDELLALFPCDDLITVICLLHDMGHPPFGHGGEVALNYAMRNHGGFESNGQTLRLLTKTESSYGPYGLDLTRRSLLGILKYPAVWDKVIRTKPPEHIHNKPIRVNDWLPPKAYFKTEEQEVAWILDPLSLNDKKLFQSLNVKPTTKSHGHTAYQSLDCSIMNIADDIAYGVHDLEDAIHLKLIEKEQFATQKLKNLLSCTDLPHKDELVTQLFHSELHQRKEAIGELVNYFITSTYLTLAHEDFENSLLKYKMVLKQEAADLLEWLVNSVYQLVIDSQASRTFEFGGQTIVLHLFDALSSNPTSLLDIPHRNLYQRATTENAAYRIISDYIAHMTDEYAYRTYEKLFGLNTRVLFER